MIFRPRIFLSSTLSENLKIRFKIESFFTSVGAEAMLYEKNLTPSINIMTYRKDILDADFIVFIIKNKYGAKTEKGISGTHEELKIALETKIPKHVYIKLENGDSEAKKIIEEIENNQISYYYFRNDEELLKRIKETTFTIAKDIMLKKVEEAQLPRDVIKKISVNHDYEEAIQIIKIVESMKQVHSNTEFDWIDSNLFDTFMSPIQDYKNRGKWVFIDGRIENILEDLLAIYNKFNVHCNDYTSIPGTHREVEVEILGKVTISRGSVCSNPQLEYVQYENIIREFFQKYNELREYVGNMRLVTDTII